MRAEFTNFPLDDNWVDGVCGDYKFSAKLFDEPSDYGIRKGRISKLDVAPRDQENPNHFVGMIFQYDRGHVGECKMKGKKEIFEAIVKLCEESPKRWPDYKEEE